MTPSVKFPFLIGTGVVSVRDKVCYVNKRHKYVVKEGCSMREARRSTESPRSRFTRARTITGQQQTYCWPMGGVSRDLHVKL
ncbi:hypothetical protein ACLOJK_038920 [Asimina triloba]